MKTCQLEGDELRHAVYALIAKEFGAAALVRYVRQFVPGQGDFTADRYLVPEPTLDDIRRHLEKQERHA